MADAPALLDSLLDERVLVFGSLPPDARDLDLLAGPAARDALRRGLESNGFFFKGGIWARFETCPPEIVEVVAAESWRLPPAELDDLFRQATPLAGCARLVRPAPHHLLLILASRYVRAGALRGSHRSRIEAELEIEPAAFAAAKEHATRWGARRSLPALEAFYRADATIRLPVRLAAIAAEGRSRGEGRLRAFAGALGAPVHRPRLGTVIALSGLDGSGKSSQADLLRDALQRLGFDAVTEWPAIDAPSRLLQRTARVGRIAVGAAAMRLGKRSADRSLSREAGVGEHGAAARRRSRLLTFAWSLLISTRGAVRLARSTWLHLVRGRIVVCDRYLLDTWVFLEHNADGRRYRLQLALQRLFAPRPRRAYLLAVSPATASGRQPERSVAENERRARIYARLAPRLGVHAVDGERDPGVICAEIARDAWSAL